MTPWSAETLTVREARTADLPLVNALCEESGRSLWTPAMLEQIPDRTVLVAVAGEQLIGVAKTHRYQQADGVAPAGHYLGGIVIGPQWRRRGVGTRLTRARMEWIRDRSDRAFYFTNERNAASIGLHGAFGFEAIAVARTLHGVPADGQTQLVLFEARCV